MKRTVLLAVVVAVLLLGSVLPVAAKGYDVPLVPPLEQEDGTIRLTGELTAWPESIYQLYRYGLIGISIDYYCAIDGVYRKVEFGPATIYRDGGHFYYWLDVLPDDLTTEDLEGPSAAGVGANFVYKWVPFGIRAPQDLGGWGPSLVLKYTPDPDPQGALPREVVQDLSIRFLK